MQDAVGAEVWFHTCCTNFSDAWYPSPESSFAVLTDVFPAVASCAVDMPAYHGFDFSYLQPLPLLFLPTKLARVHAT